MGVYIKGMEMPFSCDDCRLKSSRVYAVRTEECSYYRRSVDPYVGMGKRPDWCPLDTVIHCKDCKYCEHTLKRPNVWKPNETSDEHYNCLRIENGIQPIVFPDSFCSFGKRGDMRVTL